MFYSQFILAKKGPLGTIWIAAHLERKLRKNQVADTDIGASVDSILFPDVPIALRLSSHLLLGVVRIYSRKVNYLFHDCSEALLKIKQAFRSTAVDLPPEESTAPYHSITLPETFDLDDFELPDSALLNGNFVDHHVSTREQITLQDTLVAAGYLTSQFGLDERFGDGDASQIRLDLDDDVVLVKGSAADNISNLLGSEDVEHQISGQPETPFPNIDMDGCQNDYDDEQNPGTPKDAPEYFADDLRRPIPQNVQDPMEEGPTLHGYDDQTSYLHKGASHLENVKTPSAVPDDLVVSCPINQILPDSTENAHAPSTPGLTQEVIPANVQENPALSPSGKASPSNDMEASVLNAFRSSHVESECYDSNENDVVPATSMNCEVLKEPEFVAPAKAPSEHLLTPCDPSIRVCGDSVETSHDFVKDKFETHTPGSQNPGGVQDTCQDDATLTLNSGSSLRPCSSTMNQSNVTSLQDGTTDLLPKEPTLGASEFFDEDKQLRAGPSSVEVQGEDIHMASVSNVDTDIYGKSGHVHSQHEADFSKDLVLAVATPKDAQLEINCSDFSKDHVLTVATPKDAQLEINCSASSEYPEPERMLLATGGDLNVVNDLGQCTIDLGQCTTMEKGVTESDGSVDRVKSTRGRKRHLAESTPILLNGDLIKLSRPSQSGRNTDYIPDDDDVLASILVGRTPALKMKPTPTLPTARSSKRQRLAARVGVLKRKVLLDDTMVLHADAIRQQLINTEDIRRTRRKAPCTRPEIWMIQKCLLEEEIFSEPLLTGMSMESVVLHNQSYNLNVVPDLLFDKNCPRVEASGAQIPKSSELAEKARVDEIEDTNTIITDKSDGERQELIDVMQSSQTIPSSPGHAADRQQESLQDACQRLSGDDHPCPSVSADVDKGDIVNIGAKLPMSAGSETLSINKEREGCGMDNELSFQEDEQSLLKPAQLHEEPGEMNAELGTGVSKDEILFFTGDACAAKDESLSCPQGSDLDVCKSVIDDVPVSTVDNCCLEVEAALVNGLSNLEAHMDTSIQDMGIPACEQVNLVNLTSNQTVEQIREQNMDAAGEVEAVADRIKDDDEKPTSEIMHMKVPQAAGSDSVQLNGEAEDNPSTVGENSSFPDVIGMENSHFDAVAPRDSNVQDFCSAVGGNDTEFLNVDDEADFDEEVDNEVPDTEEAQSIENSGWSTRTRGVARFLRSLFDEESGPRRTTVAMDQLLVGKTRKEASRMFFEALVLKTKDYIQVEQENSFKNINIKPRSKLLKSEF